MYSRRLKTGYFVLEGLNSAATVYYLYYLYFYMGTVFGFGNKANLCLAALNGGTYALLAWGQGDLLNGSDTLRLSRSASASWPAPWRWVRNCSLRRAKSLSWWPWLPACVLPGPPLKPW